MGNVSRFCLLLLSASMVLAGCNLASAPLPPTSTPTPPPVELTCDEIVADALQVVGPACSSTGRNEACYGNHLVNAQFTENVEASFADVGDLVALQGLQRISTSSLNENAGTWGVSLLKAQANLPDTLPGQNVTFLLYGGAALDNATARMEGVILNTGLSGTSCETMPQAAVLMQSPAGTQVTMNINGADLTLGSTLHFTAQANGQLTISTISGTAVVQAFGTSQTVPPGAQTTLPLGSTDGLQVVGPPTDPQPFDLNMIQLAPLFLLPDPVQIPAPISPGPTTTATLPITPTLPQLSLPLPTTAAPRACIPRTDWTFTYVVQSGDTLFSIAQRFGLTLTQLQAGNCITDANRITVGQVLRVPTQLQPPATITPTRGIGPTLQPTSTTIPVFPTDTPDDMEEPNDPDLGVDTLR